MPNLPMDLALVSYWVMVKEIGGNCICLYLFGFNHTREWMYSVFFFGGGWGWGGIGLWKIIEEYNFDALWMWKRFTLSSADVVTSYDEFDISYSC